MLLSEQTNKGSLVDDAVIHLGDSVNSWWAFDCRQGLLADSAKYVMNHLHRGKFIIISNINFASITQLSARRSADRDVTMLRDAFSRLGFDVVVHCDKTARQMLDIITESMCTFLFCIRQILQYRYSSTCSVL